MVQRAVQMPHIRGSLRFSLRRLSSNAPAGFRDGCFKFADVRQKETVGSARRIVRTARGCRDLNISHHITRATTRSSARPCV